MNSALLLMVPGVGYIAASGVYLARLGRGITGPSRLLGGIIYTSLAVHVALLAVRVAHVPSAPFSGVLESSVLVSLFLVVACLIAARYWRGDAPAALVLLVAGAGLLAVSRLLPDTQAPTPDVLHSAWLWVHVPLTLTALIFYALAGSGAAMYLLVSRFLKNPPSLRLLRNLPTLDSLERFSHRMAELGFPLLTAGLFTGMVWAHAVWGHPLSGTPKQMTAVITWLVYAGYFHARFVQGMRGRRCAWILVVGCLVALIGYVIGALGVDPHSFV
jgi:ABC-type transport system involved in cytochrome c biogenesis permease subunit